MMNAISSASSYQTMSISNGAKGPPPPRGEGHAFKVSDNNQSISQNELETLTAGIAEVTGTSIDVEEVLSNFDTDSDGGLNGEELFEMLDSYGFQPPEAPGGQAEFSGSQPPPPPPPSMETAIAAYGQNSSSSMESLLDLLNNDSDSEETASVNVTS